MVTFVGFHIEVLVLLTFIFQRSRKIFGKRGVGSDARQNRNAAKEDGNT